MLKILAACIALGVIFGYATGGRLTHLQNLRLRSSPMLALGFALAALPIFIHIGGGALTILIIGGYGCVALYLIRNITSQTAQVRVGLIVLAAGWILNFVPIVANSGMPLSVWAYERAGIRGPITPKEGGFYKIVVATPESRFRFLGDVIPMPFVRQVVSLGDLLLVVGVSATLAAGMRLKNNTLTENEESPTLEPHERISPASE